MASHGAFTATTILNAADNLFAQLKIANETSNGHANSYAAYKTQEASLNALAARLSSTPMRQKTQERVQESLNAARKGMEDDLQQMMLILGHLEALPRSSITSEDRDRLDSYISSHVKHVQRKQVLLEAAKANVLDDPERREEWLAAWKEAPAVQETQTAELDALANALGSW